MVVFTLRTAGLPMPTVKSHCGGTLVTFQRGYDVVFISGKQLSSVLSVDLRTIRRDIAILQKKGVLIREGNTSAGHWVVLIQGQMI